MVRVQTLGKAVSTYHNANILGIDMYLTILYPASRADWFLLPRYRNWSRRRKNLNEKVFNSA